MFRHFILALSIIASVCSSHDASAQVSPVNPDSALQIILNEMEGSHLALSDAVPLALKNATSVLKVEATYLAARGAVRRERGLFDPMLFFSLNYLDQRQPTASFFSGAPVLSTVETATRSGVRMDLPFGTKFEASLNTSRLLSNSSFVQLSPQYTAFGNLRLRQPLLGGFQASGRKSLTKAERELDAAEARYNQEVVATTTTIERLYWNLYAAERNYAVQKLVRDQGEIFLHDTELRAKAGLIGPNQVATARTFLAEQKISLLDREEQLDQFSDRLASFIGVRPAAGKSRYITVDHPPSEYPIEPVDSLVERALRTNLDLQAAQSDVEAARASSSAAGWLALPSIDLVGSLGGSGLAGSDAGLDSTRLSRVGALGDALHQVSSREFPSWSVGVEVTIPIGLRSGLGEHDRLQAEVTAAEQKRIEQSRLLEDQVRSSYRELYHGRQRIEAAREGVDAAQEQVRIGLIEFHNGRSTAFELVRLGADYGAAQQRYSEALVRTANAAATLKQLTSDRYAITRTH